MSEPKFKVGDKVTLKGEVVEIMNRGFWSPIYVIEIGGENVALEASDLTPADETEETK